jgi:Putative GTPase activating protein for Arf
LWHEKSSMGKCVVWQCLLFGMQWCASVRFSLRVCVLRDFCTLPVVVIVAVVVVRLFNMSYCFSLTLPSTHTHSDHSLKTLSYMDRSLGVHISFVRSIAMDSWTDQQLALMKGGGNDKCNDYLKKHGIDARCPIKQKYESDAAQLYKLVLRARIEGKPEPTQLPAPAARLAAAPYSGGGGGGQDPNGMERLVGESDQQYVARQTRLREEAKARMAMKFGGGGMGGVGSGGGGGGGSSGRMQGIGSDPSYNPNGSSSGLDVSVDSLVSGLGSAWKLGGSVASSVRQTVLSEDNVQAVKSTGASFWGSLTSTVATVASQIDPSLASSSSADASGSGGMFGGSDGLAQLQRQVASQRPAQSKYTGFGSEQAAASSGGGGSSISSLGLQECPGMPGEDRDGIERLTGESDEQYVLRQTRLRDEARARMAAKFGGGGATMTSVSSSSLPPRKNSYTFSGSSSAFSGGGGGGDSGSFSSQSPARPATAPSSGNSASFTPSKVVVQSAPSSGNGQKLNSNDFFSSFGA